MGFMIAVSSFYCSGASFTRQLNNNLGLSSFFSETFTLISYHKILSLNLRYFMNLAPGDHKILNACCRDIWRKSFSHSLLTSGHSSILRKDLVCPFLIAKFWTRQFIYKNASFRILIMLMLESSCIARAARLMLHNVGQPLLTSLKTHLNICFGDVADKNIATILLISGNDSYRAWFSNAFPRSRERC